MSDRDYTDPEQRLLDQYDFLKDIKEGRRKPVGPPREQKQPRRSAEPASTPAATITQKLPSRIRLKAITKQSSSGEQPSSPAAPKSPLSKPPAPAAGVAGFEAKALPEPAATTAAEQQVQATISRAQLAALLKKKQEQQQAQPADAATDQPVAQPAAAVAVQEAVPAPSPQQQASTQPRKVLQLPAAAPPRPMAQQQQEQPSRPEAAADADIDYDAVSSPEYEVDYDAVSSPEYEVSTISKAATAGGGAKNSKQAPKRDSHIRTHTPERQDSRESPAAATRTPINLHRKTESRPGSAAARRRSRSRSPGGSRSRSPLHQQPSRQGSRGYSSRKSRSRRYDSRSRSRSRGRSRSRSPRGRGGWRRASPDYGLGAIRAPGSNKQDRSSRSRSRSRSSSRDPSPDGQQRSSSSRGQQRPGSRQGSKQRNPTLFVGDLPAVGFASDDLRQLFGAYGWKIVNARVQGSQCYGFVEFENRTDAEEALHLIEVRDEGFKVNGTFVRASWAKGSMPGWKKGKAVLTRRSKGEGLEGLEAYEHPTARLVRLQTAAAAVVTGRSAQYSGMQIVAAAAVVPEDGQLVAPGLGGRHLIDYGDL